MLDALNRPRLDRLVSFDERSRQYPIRGLLGAVPPRKRIVWRTGEQLDQGSQGACVGFSWLGEALASPVRVDLKKTGYATYRAGDLAGQVYRSAQYIDEWPGQDYEGTSVIAGVKIMVSLGFYKGYRWGFGLDDLRYGILATGSAVLGIPWLTGMWDPDPTGVLHATGDVAGGHAILCNGYEPGFGFHLQNSWGAGWGKNGGAWIPDSDLGKLLAMDGEACFPVGRSYNRG